MKPDKLTEAISRLNLAEMQLARAQDKIGGPSEKVLKEIQADVRRARMRIEEFNENRHEIADLRSSVCGNCGGRFMSETIGMYAGLRWIHTCVPSDAGRVND